MEDGRLADRARIRGARPEATSRPSTAPRASARWSARTARSKNCSSRSKLVRGLGSENIDHRLRHARFARAKASRWLGTPHRLAVDAAARAGHRLQPAQGPSAVRAARARGGAQGRASVSVIHDQRRRLGDADRGRAASRRAGHWVQALADVAAAIGRDKGGTRAGCKATRPTRPRPSPQSLLSRRAQGDPAGQRRRASPATRRSLLALAQLDRRADRRHRRLPDRSGQHRRRATGRARMPGARRPERRPDARRRPEGGCSC